MGSAEKSGGGFQITPLFALLLCSAMDGGLLSARIFHHQSTWYSFLLWNLLLAWIPYLASLWAVRWRGWGAGVCWLIFLAFLPNAGYLLTDLKHLEDPTTTLWFDAAMVGSFAFTGCLLAIAAIRVMHESIQKRFGWRLGWMGVAAASFLSGMGIYFGRFRRWNSWDIVTDPGQIGRVWLSGLGHPMDHPRAAMVTFIFSTVLFVFYLAVTSGAHRQNSAKL